MGELMQMVELPIASMILIKADGYYVDGLKVADIFPFDIT